MWCIAKLTKEYRKRMYKILDLYMQPYCDKNPTICVDEKSKQLIMDTREPIPMKPGKPEKTDYEYKRNGTRNIFVAVEPLAENHIISVTKKRTKKDFALFIKGLLNKTYKTAEKVNIVCDNLNTHFEKSFYETFSKPEANRILRRINFYYTPKHASWLNMAEIEINMLEEECIGRKIPTEKELKNEIKAWELRANTRKKKINWSFTKRDAYKKLNKHYVA